MNFITHHSTLKTNLVSFWEMQESSGTRYDAHGTNHLTANGTGGIGRGTGKVGYGADLELSDNDYFSVADNSSLDITGDMSISFWVYLESFAGEPVVFDKMSMAGQRSFYIQLRTSYIRMSTSANGTATSTADVASSLTTATWYHIVVTYTASSGTMEAWVNGSSLGTASGLNTSLYSGTAPLQIGRYQEGGTNHLDGILDQFGMWSKVLSGTEISDLYNSGTGMMYGIAYDSMTGANEVFGPGTSGSITADVGISPDRILWVTTVNDSSTGDLITSVTYNSVALTKLTGRQLDTASAYIGLWYLVNPSSGSNSITVNASSSCYCYAAWSSYSGFPAATGVIGTNTDVQYDANAPITLTLTTQGAYAWTISGVRSSDTGDHSAGTGVVERSQFAASIGDSNKAIAAAGSSSMTWDTIPTNYKITGLMANFYVPASSSANTGFFSFM